MVYHAKHEHAFAALHLHRLGIPIMCFENQSVMGQLNDVLFKNKSIHWFA